jgi:hypothetical protein
VLKLVELSYTLIFRLKGIKEKLPLVSYFAYYIKGSLEALGAVYTIDHELVPRKMPYSAVRVHGLHFMVRVLKKLIYKAIGPSLGAN